jgi:hypothetical protein
MIYNHKDKRQKYQGVKYHGHSQILNKIEIDPLLHAKQMTYN